MTDKKNIPIGFSDSEVFELISAGKYDTAVDKLADNPDAFSKLVASIGRKIQDEKTSAEKIRDRNWFQRTFSSNTKDLADIVLHQNETMSYFFVMLQMTAMAAKGNATVLYKICESLKRGTDASDLEDSAIRKVAITFMEDNIMAIEEEKKRDEAILKLLKAYIEFKHKEQAIDTQLLNISNNEKKLEKLSNEQKEELRQHKEHSSEMFKKVKDDIKDDICELRREMGKDLNDLRSEINNTTEQLKLNVKESELSLNNRIEKYQSTEESERKNLRSALFEETGTRFSEINNNITFIQKRLNHNKLFVYLLFVCFIIIVVLVSLKIM